ncbi:hypothetical protein ABC955_04255 [Citromicrobium bathyomarinum]
MADRASLSNRRDGGEAMIRRPKALIAALLAAGILAVGALWAFTSASTGIDAATRDRLFKELVDSRSDEPKLGLPRDWHACVGGVARLADKNASRIECDTWTAQGVTSTLVALREGDAFVPVVESRLEVASDDGRYVIDVVGGPGGEPFPVRRGTTDEFFDRLKDAGLTPNIWDDMRVSPYRHLMGRGFTIASVGYWGTNIRTLGAADEIEMAFADVAAAVDFYRDQAGAEPALVTTSLGNHIALGALGRERLERMNVLAVVPVMDGLQHHLQRNRRENVEKREEAEAKGEPFGEWTTFNIYSKTDSGIAFDHSQVLPLHDYVPRYVGGRDLAFREVRPRGACSRIVLGNKDPRTRDYLAARPGRTKRLIVLNADHDLAKDDPQSVRSIFRDLAQRLVRQEA